MEWTSVDHEACAVTHAMDVLGDRWSILVLREILNGVRRFDDIHEHIGVSRSVLSQRLRALVDAGVLTREAYRADGDRLRHEYRLSEMGRDLQLVMHALMEFGDRWLRDSSPNLVVRHRDCDAAVHPRSVCDAGHVIDNPRDLYGDLSRATPLLPDADASAGASPESGRQPAV